MVKPNAVIVDLDGTFALHENPKRTDHSNCISDKVNESLLYNICLLNTLRPETVFIFLTKRSTKYQIQTIKFLNNSFSHKLRMFLIMRDENDSSDSPTFKKKKLLEIMNEFNISLCYEDDSRNIEMMKSLDLNVCEVK